MSDKPTTVAEWIQRARDAGHDALGIANDPEALDAMSRVPHWLNGDEMDGLTRISPSLSHGPRGWYFWDYLSDAVHGPYANANEALEAAHQWLAL